MGPELKFALLHISSSSIACVTRCEISYWWLHLRHQQDSPWLFLFRRKCCSIQMAEITVVSIVMVLATTFMHSTIGKPTVRSINWPGQSNFCVDDFLSLVTFHIMCWNFQENARDIADCMCPQASSKSNCWGSEILITVFYRTRVRSLAMLFSNSLTHSLTPV